MYEEGTMWEMLPKTKLAIKKRDSFMRCVSFWIITSENGKSLTKMSKFFPKIPALRREAVSRDEFQRY